MVQEESKIIAVFVSNLPPRLHWKGLWATFAHHGDVLDTFIPLKNSKDVSRYGFIRFSKMVDVQRVVSRLNGFLLYRSRIFVSLVRFRDKFWKKIPSKVHHEDLGGVLNQVRNESIPHDFVDGITEKVVLERLSASIIGTTRQILIQARLREEEESLEFPVELRCPKQGSFQLANSYCNGAEAKVKCS
ncbi:hypothetical protein V6N13_096156 [Hibiscus sabdariffa]